LSGESSPPRHRPGVIALHWLGAIVVVGALGVILAREAVDDRGLARQLLDAHRQLGLGVLVVAAIRAVLNPLLRVGTVNGMAMRLPLRLLARLGHALLLVGLVATPLLGWALSNARGQTLALLGVLPLPTLLERNRDLADALEQAHEVVAWTLIALAVLHALAALWHHLVIRDGVLASMLPWRARRRVRATPEPAPPVPSDSIPAP